MIPLAVHLFVYRIYHEMWNVFLKLQGGGLYHVMANQNEFLNVFVTHLDFLFQVSHWLMYGISAEVCQVFGPFSLFLPWWHHWLLYLRSTSSVVIFFDAGNSDIDVILQLFQMLFSSYFRCYSPVISDSQSDPFVEHFHVHVQFVVFVKFPRKIKP